MPKGRRNIAIPLHERRCTICGKGIADGVEFHRVPGKGNARRSRCAGCMRDWSRVHARMRRGWAEDEARTLPPFAAGDARYPRLESAPSRRPAARRPTATTGMESLTDQQRKVTRLIAEDRTNQEIARVMHLSDQTVKNHITGIIKKLGVSSRVGIAVAWVRGQQQERQGDDVREMGTGTAPTLRGQRADVVESQTDPARSVAMEAAALPADRGHL